MLNRDCFIIELFFLKKKKLVLFLCFFVCFLCLLVIEKKKKKKANYSDVHVKFIRRFNPYYVPLSHFISH